MITLRAVSKRFGALQVLDGVDLSIAAGRVTAIVGPNSAGKTTLIKSILGLTRIDSGFIELDGVPVDAAGSYRRQIGYMPQIARFPDNLTAADVFAMMRDVRGDVRGDARGDAPMRDEELVASLGLESHLRKPLRVLSGGTRQKVNAALAFLFAPPVLILDEPTAGLDPLASSVLKDKVREMRAKGRTFVLTSHVTSELDELADDIAFLVDGQIRFAGPVRELKVLTRQLSLERAIAHVMGGGLAA